MVFHVWSAKEYTFVVKYSLDRSAAEKKLFDAAARYNLLSAFERVHDHHLFFAPRCSTEALANSHQYNHIP